MWDEQGGGFRRKGRTAEIQDFEVAESGQTGWNGAERIDEDWGEERDVDAAVVEGGEDGGWIGRAAGGGFDYEGVVQVDGYLEGEVHANNLMSC